jgi:hypothetical protein
MVKHYYLIWSDHPVRAGAAPRVLPQGDVELHGPHSRLLCHHLLHHGYDVRLCWAKFFTLGMWSGGCVFCPYGDPFRLVFWQFGALYYRYDEGQCSVSHGHYVRLFIC